MISVAGLSKSFAGKDQKVAAVASIDFEVAPGEMVTLLAAIAAIAHAASRRFGLQEQL